jgi:hypothetical protein
MKYQNKILSVLKEAINTSTEVQDITTATQNAENQFKSQGFGDAQSKTLAINAVTKSVMGDDDTMEEGFSNANQVVKYDSERSGEDPFMMNGVKWQFVNVINDKGIKDIGVYRFDHDLAYDYMWFMNEVVPKPKSSDIVTEVEGEEVHTAKFDRCVKDVEKEDKVDNPYAICQASIGADAIKKDHRTKPEDEYDRTDRADEGMDNLEVPDDVEANEKEYEEMRQLKQQAAEEDAKKVNESVIGKIKKGELERIMESLKPKKKIIKVKELKKSK